MTQAGERLEEPGAAASAAPAAPVTTALRGATPAERVLALQRQAGNRSVVRLLQRQESRQEGLERAEFERVMRTRYGVRTFRVGTRQQVTEALGSRRNAPAGGVTINGWQDWDPGPRSTVYDAIVAAFGDVERTFGGTPRTDEIVFFEMHYELTDAGAVVAQPDTGASYGGRRLTVYHAIERRNKGLPVARSNPQGRYQNPTASLGTGGSPRGAPIALPTPQESARRIIAHELGHGMAEAAHGPTPDVAPDRTMMEDWGHAVGWFSETELFDISDPVVQRALTADPPTRPTTDRITPQTWNDPRWGEQPVSGYAVEGGRSEDFAESVMTFVYAPDLLRSRSPRRHAFIAGRHGRWQRNLVRNGQVPGEAPAGPAPTRPARPTRMVVNVQVLETEDWTGADEVYVKATGPGGVERSRVRDLNDGQSFAFSLSTAPMGDFSQPVTIEVYDEDWPDADDLIVRMLWRPPYGPIRNTRSFDEANYRVTARCE